jgi:hypothetical protein
MHKTLLMLAAGLAALTLTSCGGGASVTPDNGPAPGTADLVGQLVQGGRGVSAAGAALGGVDCSLIDAGSGALLGSDTTDAGGHFSFEGVTSAGTKLLKVEFESNSDLDGDGTDDSIELNFPLDLTDGSVNDVTQEIDFADNDGDGTDDSVDVDTEVGDDAGREEHHHQRHCHKDGQTTEDTNGNGAIDGSDESFADADGDGIPDQQGEGSQHGGGHGHGHHFGLVDVRARGALEAIDDSSLTVATVTFKLTDATRLRKGNNNHATPADFAAGDEVVVKGFVNAEGELIALKVRDQHARHGDEEFGDDNGGNGGGDDVNDDNAGDSGDDIDNGGGDGNSDDVDNRDDTGGDDNTGDGGEGSDGGDDGSGGGDDNPDGGA